MVRTIVSALASLRRSSPATPASAAATRAASSIVVATSINRGWPSLCRDRSSRVVDSSTTSVIITATADCGAVSTILISGCIRSWATTPAWEIGSRAWT